MKWGSALLLLVWGLASGASIAHSRVDLRSIVEPLSLLGLSYSLVLIGVLRWAMQTAAH